MHSWLEWLLLDLCFAGAFFCAGSETGFVSWNPLKIAHQARIGNRLAVLGQFLNRHKERLLAALLVGNNVCVVGLTLVFSGMWHKIQTAVSMPLPGATLAEPFLLTPLLVLLGEMLPKSLYRIYSYRLTVRTVPFMVGLYWLTAPLTWLYGILLQLTKTEPLSGESFVTKKREEMVLVASEGARRGLLLESVTAFMQNVLLSRTTPVKAYQCSPAVLHVDVSDNCGDTVQMLRSWRADEIPAFDGGKPVGYIRTIELLQAPPAAALRSLVRPCVICIHEGESLECLAHSATSESRFFLVGHPNDTERMACDKTAFFSIHYRVEENRGRRLASFVQHA